MAKILFNTCNLIDFSYPLSTFIKSVKWSDHNIVARGQRSTLSPSPLAGSRLVAATSGSETSILTLDSTLRASSGTFTHSALLRPGGSDASRVTCAGVGLSRASVGQKASFSVDCSKAGGRSNSLVVYTPQCDE